MLDVTDTDTDNDSDVQTATRSSDVVRDYPNRPDIRYKSSVGLRIRNPEHPKTKRDLWR